MCTLPPHSFLTTTSNVLYNGGSPGIVSNSVDVDATRSFDKEPRKSAVPE